ncbi:MAG: hypothetical protein SGJ17_06755, partial [Hyphomicrobiales bacterium]|nr:hypothetical protein [Hyphomicrobiales bacterium]
MTQELKKAGGERLSRFSHADRRSWIPDQNTPQTVYPEPHLSLDTTPAPIPHFSSEPTADWLQGLDTVPLFEPAPAAPIAA